MKNDNSKNFVQNLANFGLERIAKSCKFEDFKPYLQNCIKKYNIKYNTPKGIKQIMYLSDLGIFIHFYADIQFVIMKRFLEKENNRSFSDDDVYELISRTSPTLIDKFTNLSIEDLTVEDRTKIYQDFNMILKLYDRDAIRSLDIKKIESLVKQIQEYNIKAFANKKSCIQNIKIKKELNDLGLQEYINEHLSIILKRKTKEERKEEFTLELERKIERYEQFRKQFIAKSLEDNEGALNKK